MKIQFERQDSFYKITKTIEKIPNKRKVVFLIDANNNMFANDRWGQQFRELCEAKGLQYCIKTTVSKVKNYCERTGIPCEYDHHSKINTIRSIVYSFFFKVRDFHYYVIHQRKYVKYLVFATEGLVLLGIVGYVYTLLIPQATITITPSYDIEEVSYNFRLIPQSEFPTYSGNALAIPYYQGTLPYNKILNMPIQAIRYSAQTAKGRAMLKNTSNREYALKPYTRFITDDNLIFTVPYWVNVPANGEVTLDLVAGEVDDTNQIMGIRGNITKGTTLYIRNLSESRVRKLLIATTIEDFSGGDTLAHGTVTQQDIDAFSQLAEDTIGSTSYQIVRENIKDKSIVPLMYNDLITSQTIKVNANTKVGDPLIEFDGSVEAQITYHYIKWDDFSRAINLYFAQRSTQSLRLVSIQPESLMMFDPTQISTGIMSIPMTVSTLRSYNFQTDVSNILGQITQQIAGTSKDEAHQQILAYPDISVAKVATTPFWHQTIPSVKSRINFKVNDGSVISVR